MAAPSRCTFAVAGRCRIRSLAMAFLVTFQLCVMGLADHAIAAPVAAPAVASYNIPAQALREALAAFARQSDVDIIYDPKLADGRQSAALIGRFSPQHGILVLLSGTGLICRFTSKNAAVIFAEDKPDTEPGIPENHRGASLDLDTMRVTATPLIGKKMNMEFERYGREAQSQIYRWLQSDETVTSLPFKIDITIDLRPDGRISDMTFLKGSGDPSVDMAIRNRIIKSQLAHPPPSDMPKTLEFVIALGRR